VKSSRVFNFDRGTSSQRELRQRVRRGHSELLCALQSLHDWIEYISTSRAAENYWHPNWQIRSEIKNSLALMSVANGDRALNLTNADWLSAEVEEEIEPVRRAESQRKGLKFMVFIDGKKASMKVICAP